MMYDFYKDDCILCFLIAALDDRQETSLIEIMVCCVKQAATGESPVGRGSAKQKVACDFRHYERLKKNYSKKLFCYLSFVNFTIILVDIILILHSMQFQLQIVSKSSFTIALHFGNFKQYGSYLACLKLKRLCCCCFFQLVKC